MIEKTVFSFTAFMLKLATKIRLRKDPLSEENL